MIGAVTRKEDQLLPAQNSENQIRRRFTIGRSTSQSLRDFESGQLVKSAAANNAEHAVIQSC
jgi:hypothetical protein